MAKFHRLKVADIKQETPDCVSIAFDVPELLKGDYAYTQGQYLTLKMTVGGEEIRRSYSICSSPLVDSDLRIAVKKIEGGKASTLLCDTTKVGDEFEVMTPDGKFYTQLDASQQKQYVAFAAGSGITPIMSILKTTLATEKASRFVLFYGNRDSQHIIFKNELAALSAEYGDRLVVCNILSREEQVNSLFNGRITKAKAGDLLNAYVDVAEPSEYFLCGPEEMINIVSTLLKNLRVNVKNIHFELFTTPVSSAAAVNLSTGDAIEAEMTVILDGEEHTFKLASNGKNLLDACIDQNLDVPFACKGAVCCTCKARVLEGEMHMVMNYALEEEEVEQGYILTCQSHPKTAKVLVDYDV